MPLIQKFETILMAFYERRIMACVAISEFTCTDVEGRNKNGYKHAGRVVGAELIINPRQNAGWREIIRGPRFNQCLCNRHEKCRWDTFIRNVTNAEEEPVVIDKEEIIEIPPYFMRRLQCCIDTEFVTFGERGESLRHHAHLDFTANIQLRSHSLVNLGEQLSLLLQKLRFLR